ncbi:hypothetical protein ALQ16_200038 [Pseudomonas syringae pv. actinidiae]|nr:hypothetical protein ALQ16_200038 [Pseudomonas syringae pv. actinidiae]
MRRRDFNTKVFCQWLKAAGKALGDAAEFPRALAQIELAQNQRGFFHTVGRDIRFNAAGNVQGQARHATKAGFVLVDGRGQGNLLDDRVQAAGIEAEHRTTGRRFRLLDRAAVHAFLAVETHVLIATHLAGTGQQERRYIDIRIRERRINDLHRQRTGSDWGVGARDKLGHARTAPMASSTRSSAVRPLVAWPTAVKSQPEGVRDR